MAAKVFENPATGYRETVGGGAIAGALFLGPLYFLAKGLWTHALIWMAVALLLLSAVPPLVVFLPPIYAALASSLLKANYLRKGWKEIAAPPPTSPPVQSDRTQQTEEEAAATIFGKRADNFLIALIALVLGLPLLILLLMPRTAATNNEAAVPNPQSASLLVRMLRDESPPPAQPRSESEVMDFENCKTEIENAAAATAKEFSKSIDSEMLYSGRFTMDKGSVLASCSTLDAKMVITRSPAS
jgi:hypothetical protein